MGKEFAQGLRRGICCQFVVVDGQSGVTKRLAKVPHGTEKNGDSGFGGRNVAGFVGRFRHPDLVVLGVEVFEGGGITVQLIAKDENEIAQRHDP